jgi:penicillin-binding protein 1C
LFDMKRKSKIWLRIAVIIILFSGVIYLITPDASQQLDRYGKIVLDRNGKILRAFLNEDEQWCFLPQNKPVPAKLEKAVLTFEDRYFYQHPGFNPVSIYKALVRNIKAGKIVAGGSTITMQVCRLAHPGKRTLSKKLLELLHAFKLEILYSKKHILALYLNNAPYGGNIVGIRAAAYKYYGREPEQLSWAEAALLAVLPNAPAQLSPGRNQQLLIEKRNRLLHILADKGYFDQNTCLLSCLEPAPDSRRLLPCQAPHLTRLAANRQDEPEISTTIDRELQNLVENTIDFRSSYLQENGIKNLAALVADNASGEILVWIGSQDFYDEKSNGQVDGVLAARSPGSTLKPFLYALAMDEGLIVPETKIHDVPTYFRGFQPENANKCYEGWVNTSEALTRSLNIPAVRLLNLYGYERFYYHLKDAGISTLFRPASGYGLTLIIGGCEVKMLDLAALFSGLANYGKFKPLRYLKNEPETKSVQLLSPGSSWQILNITSELVRPGSENYWHQYDNQAKLAWKTGTSYGHRDAWAVGVNPQYTIAVWTGNFTNESNPSLTGAASAGPLLFAIFNALPKNSQNTWFRMPENEMQEREICSVTGLAPSKWCSRDTILVSRQAKSLRLCPNHQPFQIAMDGKNTVCSKCWQSHEHETRVYLLYPPQVKKYLDLNGYPIIAIPPHLPNCPTRTHDQLQIDYPQPGALIFLPRDIDLRQQKMTPQISGYPTETRLFWYLDDEYLGTSIGKENIPLLPTDGTHTLSIITPSGNTATTTFTIQLPEQ